MKRMRMLGLCLVAAFAISVAATATASAALPEFVPAQIGQTVKSVSGPAKLETPGLPPIECKSSKGAGKLEGTKETRKIKVTFKGCTAESGAKTCQSGTTAGVIKTKVLKGLLGYLVTATKIVGTKISPESGTLLAKFTCGEGATALVVESTNVTYGENAPINVSSTKGKLALRNGGAPPSGQQWQDFEGESPAHFIESFFVVAGERKGPFASNQQQENTTTTKEALEIRA